MGDKVYSPKAKGFITGETWMIEVLMSDTSNRKIPETYKYNLVLFTSLKNTCTLIESWLILTKLVP